MSSTNKVEGGEYIVQESDDEVETTMRFCGVCDMRIATIFVNGFHIALILFGILVMGIKDNMFFKAMGSAFAAGLPGLVLSGVGLYGAKTFDIRAMYLAVAGFAVILLVDAIMWQWVGFIITSIVLFPHTVLTMEMRNGIITKETYHDQQYISPEGMEFVERAHAYIAPSISVTPV